MEIILNAWYALAVSRRRESVCESALSIKGYEVLNPCYTDRILRRRRLVYAERSIFPGYLFCKIGSEAIGKIVATPGVLRIVGFGTKPAIVNEEEIASIRTIVSSNVVRAPWKYLPNGCGVLIEDGPLKGVKGVILSDGIGRKLVVSVSLLQRSLAVTIDASTRLRALPLAYQKTSQALGRESQLAMRLAM